MHARFVLSLLTALLASLFSAPAMADEPPVPAPPRGLGGDAAPASDPATPAATVGLEDLLRQVLTSNPEVLMAEAKLRQAEAELHQARLKAAQSVTEAHAARQKTEQELLAARKRLNDIEQLAKAGRVSQADAAAADQQLAQARAAVAQTEAQLRYLVGTGPDLQPTLRWGTRVGNEWLSRWVVGLDTPMAATSIQDVSSQDPMRQLVSLSLSGASVRAAVTQVQSMTGIVVVVDPTILSDPVSAVLLDTNVSIAAPRPLPLRAWLQAIGDQANLAFVPREYGALLTFPERAEKEAIRSALPR